MTESELVQGAKDILDRSNIILIYVPSTLFKMIYQQDSTPKPLNQASKVLLTMSLLIITCNRIQYEGNFSNGLRIRLLQTGPLLPTLRYLLPEILLIILLVLEGFKAGGPESTIAVILLFIVLLALGSNFRKPQSNKDAEPEKIETSVTNV
ncbi:hypothetical protein DL96DRAFT_1688438 [Flagelloscypha sp. PMI_526]|nr:hypothetical protein DL96DRAFT_1688438 [Flagelloscypha sp. PMI_526]